MLWLAVKRNVLDDIEPVFSQTRRKDIRRKNLVVLLVRPVVDDEVVLGDTGEIKRALQRLSAVLICSKTLDAILAEEAPSVTVKTNDPRVGEKVTPHAK